MGVDIYSWSGLQPAKDIRYDEDLWEYKDREGNTVDPQKEKLIALLKTEKPLPRSIKPGTYRADDTYDFRAGTHSGFGSFLNNLDRLGRQLPKERADGLLGLFGKKKTRDFSPIMQSDVMDAKRAAKLLELFNRADSHAKKLKPKGVDDGWFSVDDAGDTEFYKAYADWKRALELASNKGALVLDY